jgi:hypothetical protein
MEERVRLKKIVSRYRRKDVYNGDESGFIQSVAPDAGLSSKKLSGKKKDKARISVLFVSNANGSDKREPFFIGKAKNPRCFKKKKPSQLGLYYWNNTKAWMTRVLFKE